MITCTLFIKIEQGSNDHNHFKAAILHKEKQSAYMPFLIPWLKISLLQLNINFFNRGLNEIEIEPNFLVGKQHSQNVIFNR